MSEINMTVTGLPHLRRTMRRLQNPDLLRPAFSRAGWRIVRFMGVYPPPLADQQYERTGRYGREWEVEMMVGRGRISVTARNERPGGEYVGSEQMQAGIHLGRWRTDEQALDHVRPYLLDDLRDVIERG